jgi:NAD(P)-dependent dehydrogenase (short-subunit alcohol dehydrogenase family)
MTEEHHRSIANLISLKTRRAVVTGAARGIGLATARRLAEAGAAVVLLDKDAPTLKASADELAASGATAVPLTVDLADGDALATAFEVAVAQLGGLDIWVNNAGISPRVASLEITERDWDQVLDLNLKAAFNGAKLAARYMISHEVRGVIINMTSSTVKRATGNPLHYRVSKHGIVGLTQSLAVELGPKGIRCLAVAPTLTETPWVAQLRSVGYAEGFDRFTKRIPLRRSATADEIARVVLFAVSDLAAFVTGTVIEVDGGESSA